MSNGVDVAATAARQLARVLSLAARIEPELLRAARIHLLPHLDASAEADLWFSPLVQSRTPLAIVLRLDALESLRAELSADRGLLEKAWELIDRIHDGAPPVLRLEERLTWLGLSGEGSSEDIERELRKAVFSMVDEDRGGIARWSARAFDRLPRRVREAKSAQMLNVGAKARLGSAIDPEEIRNAGPWLRYVVPSDIEQVDIGVRLLEGAVELGAPSTDGAHLLKVPQLNPPFVEVSWQRDGVSSTHQIPIPQPIQPVIVATGTTTARIRTGLGQTYELKPHQRLATERVFGLRGRIVAMDDVGTVIEDGTIVVENQTIIAVLRPDERLPGGFEDIELIDVEGTIYPGLIELHNHLAYDALPLWRISRLYSNRSQWAQSEEYRAFVTGPAAILHSRRDMSVAAMRFVEARCLAAGVTTSQGSAAGAAFPIPTAVLRIAEKSQEKELRSARDYILAPSAEDILGRMASDATQLIHLSEGTDQHARAEFQRLRTADGSWAISPSVAVIHATALGPDDLKILGEHGAAVVWSPLHDLILYGRTLDVRAARAAGLRIGIGSSWSVTGSRNLLGELKWARAASRFANASMSDADLVASVTRVAAEILGWGRLLGSIVPGKRADLVVIRGTDSDPYAALVDASEADVRLVLVDGIARVGAEKLMPRFARGREVRKFGGEPHVFDFDPVDRASTPSPPPDSWIADAETFLRDTLRRLPELAPTVRASSDRPAVEDELSDENPASQIVGPWFAGIEPMELEPLTIAEDPDYLSRILDQRNIPREYGEELTRGPTFA